MVKHCSLYVGALKKIFVSIYTDKNQKLEMILKSKLILGLKKWLEMDEEISVYHFCFMVLLLREDLKNINFSEWYRSCSWPWLCSTDGHVLLWFMS